MALTHRPSSPVPPHPWLAVRQYGFGNMVVGVFASRDDPELLSLVRESEDKAGEPALFVTRDDPSLDVHSYGFVISNPACLSARDIWFRRFESVLAGHLRDPRPAQVFTFADGGLPDPICTHKASADGPFPFPANSEWPTCGYCHHPMAFMGVLDFRGFTEVRLPGDSLVFHACNAECGPCADTETVSLTWLSLADDLRILGGSSRRTTVGTAWTAMEYPTPAYYPEDLSSDESFRKERGIYFNFSCFADKIGGHVFWIQGDETPSDRSGRPMRYLGQLLGSDDVKIGDTGIAYIFYSEETGETKHIIQYF